MTLYVVETVLDELVQVGCSLDKKLAEKMAEKLNQKTNTRGKYWVAEYHISDKKFTKFE